MKDNRITLGLITILVLFIWGNCIVLTGTSSAELTDQANRITVRNAHAMAFHSKESNVYLFGGADEKEVLSDLWILNGAIWEKVITDEAPPARTFSSLTYDVTKDQLILFGGNRVLFGDGSESQIFLNDTWTYKDKQWQKLITQNAPAPRAEASMVFDESRNRIVLFGGYTIQNKEYVKLGDTWEFYDKEWHLVSEKGPSGRHGTAMVFDSDNNRITLFGGSTADKQYGKDKGETWTWNGETWRKLQKNQPPGVFNAAMIFDKERKEIIRFGGWNGESRIGETWILQNEEWRNLELEINPSPRNHSAMVYLANEKKAILFGGHNGDFVFGDTWEFQNNTWKKLADTEPIKRKNNGH